MAATLKKLSFQLTRNVDVIATSNRCISTTCVLDKNLRAGRYKTTTNRSKPLTYEMAQGPHKIGVTKTWNSWNTSTLKDEDRKSPEITIEDMFIRRFMNGTWPRVFASEIIIKRRLNMIVIGGFIKANIMPTKIYFLTGYTEELLSNLLKRPVKVELQTLKHYKDMVFKHI